MSDSTSASELRTSVSMRDGVPMLYFVFLLQKTGDRWFARSLHGGFGSEAETADAAENLLTRSIDLAIKVAADYGQSVSTWYESLGWPRDEVLREIVDELARHNPERHERPVDDPRYIRNVAVLRQVS